MDYSIVIPTYNRKLMLKRLLESIYKNLNDFSEIIVVDDASTDGTGLMIKEFFPEVKYVVHKDACLVGRSRNDGIMASRCELVLMIDDDNVVPDPSIEEIIRYMEVHPEVGVVGPVTCYLSAPNKVMYAGSIYSKFVRIARFLYALHDYEEVKGKILDVDGIPNCSVIRRSLAFRVGLIDYPRYPFLGEDGELIYKIKRLGYKVQVYGDSRTLHDVPLNPRPEERKSRNRPFRFYYAIRSKIFFLKDFESGVISSLGPFIVLFYYFGNIFLMSMSGSFSLKNFFALTSGLLDGLFGYTSLRYS